MEPQALENSDVSLMDGERIDSALDLKVGLTQSPADGADLLLLTNKRLIYVSTNGRRRRSAFLPVREIASIEVAVDRSGFGAYVWAGLAFLVAGLLWRVIDHPAGSAAAAIAVGLMGVYLVVEKFMEPGKSVVKYNAGSAELQCDINGPGASTDIYDFINKVFQMKEGPPQEPSQSERKFVPWW